MCGGDSIWVVVIGYDPSVKWWHFWCSWVFTSWGVWVSGVYGVVYLVYPWMDQLNYWYRIWVGMWYHLPLAILYKRHVVMSGPAQRLMAHMWYHLHLDLLCKKHRDRGRENNTWNSTPGIDAVWRQNYMFFVYTQNSLYAQGFCNCTMYISRRYYITKICWTKLKDCAFYNMMVLKILWISCGFRICANRDFRVYIYF